MEENKTDSIKTKIANKERSVNKEKEQAEKKSGDKKNAGTKTPNGHNSIDETKKKKFLSIFSFKQVLLLFFIIFLICIGGFLLYDKKESFNSSIHFLRNLFTLKDAPITTDVNNPVEDDGMSIDSNKDSNMVMEENDYVGTFESVYSKFGEAEKAEEARLEDDLVGQTSEQNTEQPKSSGSFYSESLEGQNDEDLVPQEQTSVQRVLPLVSKEKRDLLRLIRKGSILVSKLSVDDLKIINDIQEEDSSDDADDLPTIVFQKLKNLIKVRKIDSERVDMEEEYKIEFRKQKLLTDFVCCSSMAAIGLYDEAITDVKAVRNTLMQHFNVESEHVELLSNVTSRIKNKLKTLNENG